jgi:hypothetical protein
MDARWRHPNGRRLSVRAYAGAIEPTARHSCPSGFPGRHVRLRAKRHDICRSSIGAVQRQALAHKPFAEIGVPSTERIATVRPFGSRLKGEQSAGRPGNECAKVVCCLHRREPKRESESALGRPRSLLARRAPNPSPSLSPLASTIGRGDRTSRLACRKATNAGARRFSRPMLRFWPARLRVYRTTPDSTNGCVFGR